MNSLPQIFHKASVMPKSNRSCSLVASGELPADSRKEVLRGGVTEGCGICARIRDTPTCSRCETSDQPSTKWQKHAWIFLLF